MTEPGPIKYTAVDGVARITLARPAKRNALSPESIGQLHAAFERAASDVQVRAIVLDAEGPDFCAGVDLDALARLVDAPPEAHRADARALADLFLAMRAHPNPIIAAVQGRALAGGAGLVTACDIVIASTTSSFGYPEVRIGFVAAMVTALLRMCVPEKAAFELLSTGRQVPAEEAHRLGIVTRLVAPDELRPASDRIAGELAGLPADAVTRTKRMFYGMIETQLREALDKGIEANVDARSTGEFRAGLSSFISRRRGSGS